MSHGIEGRVPYCDHRLVEFAAKLPARCRLAGGINKKILREAAAEVFPDLPPTGGKKAFVVPLDGAYGAMVREIAGDVLNSQRFRNLGLFNVQAVDGLLKEFPNPSFLVGRQIMALVMFALWHEAVGQRAPVLRRAAS